MKNLIALIPLLGLFGCYHTQQRKPLEMYDYSRNMRKEMQKAPDFSEHKYKEALDRKYAALFGEQKPEIRKYPDAILKQTFKMYDNLSFYTLEKHYLTGMEDVFAELKKRGLEKSSCVKDSDKGTCIEDMFSAYITQGDLLSAKRIQKDYPALLDNEQVPDISEAPAVSTGTPRLYRASPDGKTFNLESVDIKSQPVMVAIMSTECHFSRRIMKYLLATPALKREFEDNAIIILPVNASLSFIPDMTQWNNENPKLAFRVYTGREDLRKGWEQFDFTSIPQFYFIKNDAVVDYIGGWGPNDEEFAAKLRSGFEKLKSEQKE